MESTEKKNQNVTQEPEAAARAPQAARTEDPPTLVRFSKPYTFEGETFTEIDLAGIENLTTADMTAAEKHLVKNNQVSATPEMTMEYVCYIAMLSTDKPIEFFRGLPVKDAIKLKNRVTNFFYGED